MPPSVSPPLVKPKGIDDVPVVTIALWSKTLNDAAMRALGLKLLQNFKQISDTGQGFVVGGRAEQIKIEVSPERLKGFGISLGQA